ncbi:MAG: thioesterase family protein [Bacteroidia bacterium]|nr:thioesterase family protein [Bacteroidia bacterium]
MISHETFVRVRYGETDQMAYVYYGKYAEYFEVGRVELIRSIGITYKEIEEKGILMPVADLEVHYKFPARYDELLKIKTTIPEKPRASFLTEYEIFNEEGKLVVTGKVKLAFFDKERLRPVRAPKFVLDAVEAHWTS